jgi:hypothetical protein
VAAVVAAAAILFTLELASNSDEGGDDGDENLDHTHISSRCFFEEGRKAERQNSKVGLWLGWGGIAGGIIRKAVGCGSTSFLCAVWSGAGEEKVNLVRTQDSKTAGITNQHAAGCLLLAVEGYPLKVIIQSSYINQMAYLTSCLLR